MGINSNILNLSNQELKNLFELFKDRKYNKAKSLALSILKKNPNNELCLKILSIILFNNNNHKQALKYNLKIIKLNPNNYEAYFNQGNILSALGNIDKAEDNYKNAIILNNNYFQAYNNLGIILKTKNKLQDATLCYKKAIEIKKDYSDPYNNLGTIFKDTGNLSEAETNFRKAIKYKPYFFQAYNNLGNVYRELLRFDEAENCYNQAIKINSKVPELFNNLGLIFKNQNKIKEAELNYRKALEIHDEYTEAYRNLVEIKKFYKKDIDYLKIQKILKRKDLSIGKLSDLNFALAKILEDLGLFRDSFKYYKVANKLRKKQINFKIDNDKDLFSKIKNNNNKYNKIELTLKKLSNDIIPIFIIGMPRSGTTLVEQIISAHTKIKAGGELNFINNYAFPLANNILPINKDTLFELRIKYFQQLKIICEEKNYVTDKMPLNFRFVDLILYSMPEAKIIHVNRNPKAVCWSNFKHYFVSDALGFSYDINDIIEYYKSYKNLMNLWYKKFHNRIHYVDYELLTEHQEIETKKIIDYIGLDWDTKCLFPEKNNNISLTASNLQVTKKIYKNSSKDWQKFSPYLNHIFDKL